ncbi:MAG: aminotransferase class V-fold PLP-dependent enzyme [Gemmatimonadetes bacterium]|nr:aminotransferase class V-fold PLP-dependent enzyme [Gemmatimonadota bacterium]
MVELDDSDGPPVEAMRAAIGDGTRAAAVFYLGKNFRKPKSVPLEQAVAMAHAVDVPVIVDAASECPPVSTLTRFTEAGADLVIFSGGKSLQGPQSTGLIIGRKELISACAVNGTPFATVGRPMKVSREEILAFIKALEIYLNRDHAADAARWEGKVRYIEAKLAGISYVSISRIDPEETYAVPQLKVTIDPEAGLTGDDAVKSLLDGSPRIVVQERGEEGFSINPHNLQDGQERIVAERCREVLTSGRAG